MVTFRQLQQCYIKRRLASHRRQGELIGEHMSRAMTENEITGAFATFCLSPNERDIRELRDLISGSKHKHEVVLYRTVLTNGTGEIRTKPEAQDAELERDAS